MIGREKAAHRLQRAVALALVLAARSAVPAAAAAAASTSTENVLQKHGGVRGAPFSDIIDHAHFASRGATRLAGGNVIPVTSCADDGSPGTLRAAVLAAATGDTVDLAGLACSTITQWQPMACAAAASALP